MHKRLLLVDGMNNFLRSYVVNPSLDANGSHVGGLVGFLNSLKKAMVDTKPDAVIVAWEGANGSRKRREINKQYKAGRKPPRLNREYDYTPEEEAENKLQQLLKLIEYLEKLPVLQMSLDDVEADDVIAWATKSKHFSNYQKIIFSNDKDFLQLCDDKTILYRPTTKKIHNKNKIIEEYKIHPRNFAIAKAIAGDKSDNISGATRVGLTTVAKRFPFLAEDKDYLLQNIFDFCNKQIKDNKKPPQAYAAILECSGTLKDNYDIVQLYEPMISLQGQKRLSDAVEAFIPRLQKNNFRLALMKNGISGVQVDILFQACTQIVLNKR
jgi:5'-3' exonuclease